MDLVLLIGWTAALAGGIRLLLRARKGRYPWGWLAVLELAAGALALGLARYFDSLPGYGFMPGLTWLAHVLICLAAAAGCGLLLAVTAALWLRSRRK